MFFNNVPFRSTAWRLSFLSLVAMGIVCEGANAVLSAAEPGTVDFRRDVRPILSNHCFQCHGPDEKHREAELRLDLKAGLLPDGGEKQLVIPGKPAASELIARVTSDDESVRMPPAEAGKPLSAEQVETLRRWIAEGAKWEEHWSYAKPQPVEPPAMEDAWARNEIDRFVLARLREEKLSPATEADRATLIRRLSLDLTGLPPSPEEVQAFVADDSPKAYEELVERLLRSPHYGERMAMYWLDLVRYADTNGIHGDNHRDHAPYRDYVIEAFNRNLPFDQFTVEQLAGDLLPSPDRNQRIASGYNRLNMTTREGGAQAKEYIAKYAADRVRNASTVWLGGTLGCAECHDHKFDPFTTADFYRFAAFFADVQETPVGTQQASHIPTEAQQARLTEIEVAIRAAQARLATDTPEIAELREAWAKGQREKLLASPPWQVMKVKQTSAEHGTTFEALPDGSLLTAGPQPATDTYTIALEGSAAATVTGLRLEALRHASLSGNKLSRSGGNFVLSGVKVEVIRQGVEQGEPVKIRTAMADFEQPNFGVAGTLDDDANSGWAVDGGKQPADRAAVFILEKPLSLAEGDQLVVRLEHLSKHAGQHLGRFRISSTTAAEPALDVNLGLPGEVAEALRQMPEKRLAKAQQAIVVHYRSLAPPLAADRAELAKLEAEQKRINAEAPAILVAMAGSPRTVRVLPRGNWLDDSGQVVEPGVPRFLGDLNKTERATRLDLARWLVSAEHPLTARVFVNRLWKLAFGDGLARNEDDFGSQGPLPTHPELLDWLAVEFVDSGWDVKHMLRLMVNSAAYRQSSTPSAEAFRRDPYNLYLARQARFRLDAEMVRDTALAASGLLVDEVGGLSVKPYQPDGYWDHLNFPKRTWVADTGKSQYRRGLYTYWCRTFLHPSLLAFDAPTREECTVDRPRSNTPLQALVLLNDPTYVEAARALAEQLLACGDAAQGLKQGYLRVLAREPRAEESKLLLALLDKHLAEYRADPAAAAKTLNVGLHISPGDMKDVELAAWTSVARVLLNLHEAIMRY